MKKVSIMHEIYKMSKKNNFVFFFMFIFPIFIGVYFLFMGTKEIIIADKSSEWPSVQGKIVISLLGKNISEFRRHPRGAPEISFSYEYEVHKNTFTGNKVMYGYINNFFTSDSYRRSKIYPKGKAIKVYYNPNNHTQSVLEPGINFPYSWNKILIALILLLPLYFIIKYEFLSRSIVLEQEK